MLLFIIKIIGVMTEGVKYLTAVGEMLQLYQNELIDYLRKAKPQTLATFSKQFHHHLKTLKQIETAKSITQDCISVLCEDMDDFIKETRPRRTSQSQRYNQRANLRSQEGNRDRFRFAGSMKKGEDDGMSPNPPKLADIAEVSQGFKMEAEFMPKMRMKWKNPTTAKEQQSQQNQEEENRSHSTMGSNNIDLLSYTIPEIQNSIKRLSYQRSPKSTKQRELEMYRTLDSRLHTRKKYIDRLF